MQAAIAHFVAGLKRLNAIKEIPIPIAPAIAYPLFYF